MTFSTLFLSRAYRYFTAIAIVTIVLSIYHTSFRHPDFPPNERHNSRPAWTIHTPWEDNELSLISPPSKAPYEPLKTDSAFINWLSARVPTDHVPFVTVGDCQYIHALRNFHHQLEQWGYGDDMVVICLDQCCADVQDYHSYTRYMGESVAYIKFKISLDLTAAGYNWIFFDGDVYLTGASDPFSTMLPLSNSTWDLQIQTDHPEVLDYNIGWYFAKSTPRSIEFFRRSYALWNETQEWDQAIMWKVGFAMEHEVEEPLRVHHLNLTDYKNFMLYGLDYPFTSPATTQHFADESTMIHFTCIEQALKTYFGYYFGGFGDLDGYYSDGPTALLATANVAGLIDAVHAQVAFAAQLAHNAHRTFVWPDTVDLVQRRFEGENGEVVVLERKERFAGIRAMSWESARVAKLAAVEGNYLENVRRVVGVEMERVVLDAGSGVQALEEQIAKLGKGQVPVIDFAHFTPPVQREVPEEASKEGESEEEREQAARAATRKNADWLAGQQEAWFKQTFEPGGYLEYSQEFGNKLKKCSRADEGGACLGVCSFG